MKKIFLLLITILAICRGYSQALTHEQRLADLGRVWGFLKYFHPAVADGRHNWDSVLIAKMEQVDKLGNAEAVNNFYQRWLDELGTVEKCRSCTPYTDEDILTAGLGWLQQHRVLDKTLRTRLLHILQNRYNGDPYYIEVKKAGNIEMTHEPVYETMAYPSRSYRLLGLFRYWNVIQYFYPYKKDIGEDWNEALEQMVVPFRDAPDTLGYHAVMWQLTARLNDSHSMGVCSRYIPACGSPLFGVRKVPVSLQWIEDNAVVTRLTSDSLCALDDIRVNDVVKKVDGRTPREIIDANWQFIGGSNERVRYRNNVATLLHGHGSTVQLQIEREGKQLTRTVHRYTWEEIRPSVTLAKGGMWKMLEDGVGYIHMGRLTQDSVKTVMNALKDTRVIVIDIRNYPQNTFQSLSRYTHPKAAAFVYPTLAQPDKPGLFKKGGDFFCGGRNAGYYKGKLILLVDEYTQSHAEFSVMALQTAPDVVTIGSQTAGADGNVSGIIFPGGYAAMMTGIGVYYPDGRPTQRVGVHIDIPVSPTLSATLANRDEILERAIQYIHHGQ